MTTATKAKPKRIALRGLPGRTQDVAESRGYTFTRTGQDVFTLRKNGHAVITGDLVTVHFSIPGAPGIGMGFVKGPLPSYIEKFRAAHIATIKKARAAVPGRLRRLGY